MESAELSERNRDEQKEDADEGKELLAQNTSKESSKSDGSDIKKKRRFKPGKFISKLNLKIKKKVDEDQAVARQSTDEGEKISTPKLGGFRRTFVKRFSRRKSYKVSPMASNDNNVSNDTAADEPLNNEKEISKISQSDPTLCNSNSVETMVLNKMNEDSLEFSKSMQTVDKSVYTTYETKTSSSSSFKNENKKVQLKITISGKKVEKVNATSASDMTTTQAIVSENEIEVDKASPVQQEQQQQQHKSRADIILPSTSTTVRVSTSSGEGVFDVMVPRNSSTGGNANMHVLHQAKSISKPSVAYSTVVKEGLSSASEREIEKYLVLTSNLNSIISAAKDLDILNYDATKRLEFPTNLPELKIYENPSTERESTVDPQSNLEKERQLMANKGEMKKSRIPVNKQRRSSHDHVEREITTPTVHTQEAHKPYNLNLSTSVSTEDLGEPAVMAEEQEDKELPTQPLPSPPPLSELKPESIKFELGTPVRPPKMLHPSPISPIADIVITEAELSTSINDHESHDDAFYSPTSESSITISKRDSKTRRKIAYIPELSIYTAEEQELLKSNITANYSESFDIPSLPPDSSIFPVFDESSVSSMTPATPEKRECLYKILVIGELGTGKTSFIKRYVHQFFSQNYRATIGVDFALKVLSWDEKTIIRLQLWDIAGQERFGNMTRVYYKEAVGAFIVFDVTRTPTFDAVNKWKQDLDSKVQLPDGSPIPCILLANKCDQQKQGLVTMPAKMDEYCRQNGFAGWFETSAKDNTNIEESAKALVSKILLNDKLIHNDMLDGDRLVLDAEDLNKPKKFCSC